MNCEYLESCAFVQQMVRTDPLTAYTVRITYCNQDKKDCARYGLIQAVGPERVPDFLWPNDEEEASEVAKINALCSNREVHIPERNDG